MDSNILLETYLKQLKLPTFSSEYRRVARQCAKEKRGFEPFLQQLTELEVQHRRIRTMQRRMKEASFPAEKNWRILTSPRFRRLIKNGLSIWLYPFTDFLKNPKKKLFKVFDL